MVNTYMQLVAAGGGVAIVSHSSMGRSPYTVGFAVYRVRADGREIPTRSDAPWYDHNRKVFLFPIGPKTAEAKLATLQQAQAWVAEQGWYDGPWARNRMGDWLPAHIHKQFPLQKQPRKAKVT